MIFAGTLSTQTWHGVARLAALAALCLGVQACASNAGKDSAKPAATATKDSVKPAAPVSTPGGSVTSAKSIETATVRDPNASFIDVKARQAFLKNGKKDAKLLASLPQEFDCTTAKTVDPQPGPMVIPPRYAVGNHGDLHPDYERIVALYRDFEDQAGKLSALYVSTAKPVYATCLVDLLAKWADGGALLNYDPVKRGQVWFQTEWSIGVAAQAYSLVMTEPTLDAAKKARVLDWFSRVSKKQISVPGEKDGTCCNNHSYWRGLQATMIGVITKDDELFRWGLNRYVQAIGEIAADGSMPLEMARHEQALHYQNYALEPMTMIAEIASRQGIDLYAYQVNGRDFHTAVAFLAAALKDDAVIAKYASEKQDKRAFAPGRGDMGWTEFYQARFKKDPLGFLEQPIYYPRNGGAITMLVYTPK
ncbi:MAG: hypothetical protein JWL63_1654 [Rhodocyclales bacterium]|nr:hypothetical protein [Rhodocyclales bacterium]